MSRATYFRLKDKLESMQQKTMEEVPYLKVRGKERDKSPSNGNSGARGM